MSDPKKPNQDYGERILSSTETLAHAGSDHRENEDTLSVGAEANPSKPRTRTGLPETIGDYRILGILGEGGMGVVYEAEQQNPNRRVALKVMRGDHVVDDLHTRLFQREAETLGRLKHPNIAAIYESGHTDDNRDFFAMELVRGQRLDDWLAGRPETVDRHELDLRLRLFRTIADGVHYAHQRGVIHRDLKPSNIIIQDPTIEPVSGGSQSAVPRAKILDFGLARITDQAQTDSMLTEVGMLKGTVPYMSPEQALGHPDEVDVRTDVYALGIILYELISGRRPYDTAKAALGEALRVICEEPPRPLRESWSGSRRLDEDIETIVGKALEKEPGRRYGSVASMSDDVDRYLTSQPISARPPSALYQLRKFARRNRSLVASAATALAVVVVFAATTAVQSRRIQREAERANREANNARQVADFLINLFDQSHPTTAQGEELSAREILEAGADRIESLGNQPLIQASFMESIGRVYTVLGDFDRAEALLEEAVAIRQDPVADDELALARSLHHLATLLDAAGRHDDAEEPIRQALAIREQRLGDHPDHATSLNVFGNILWHQGRLDIAEVEHRKALAMRQELLPEDHTDIAQSLHNLGALRYFAGDYQEAEALYKRSIEIEEAAHGPNNWNLATSLHTLAIVYQDQRKWAQALANEKRSLTIREKVLGPEHPHVALSLTTLGNIYRGMDRPASAEPLIRRAVAIAEASWGPDHGEVWWMKRSLVRTLIALEKYAEADNELARLIRTVEVSGDASSLAMAFESLADLRTREGRFDEALEVHERAIALHSENDPEGADVGYATAGLARTLEAAGRTDEAVTMFRQAIPLMEAVWGTDDRDVRKAQAELEALLGAT